MRLALTGTGIQARKLPKSTWAPLVDSSDKAVTRPEGEVGKGALVTRVYNVHTVYTVHMELGRG